MCLVWFEIRAREKVGEILQRRSSMGVLEIGQVERSSMKIDGFVVALVIFAAIVAFLFRAMLKQQRKDRAQYQICAARQCEYFTDYLMKGPAFLSHSQYHEAANGLAYWSDDSADWKAQRTATRGVDAHAEKMRRVYAHQVRKA